MDSEEASVRVVLACGQTSNVEALGPRIVFHMPIAGDRTSPAISWGDTKENTDIKGLLTETSADLATVSRNRK